MGTPFDEIQQRHEALLATPFPSGHRMKTVGDTTLGLIQSEVAGFILTYVETNGSLGTRQRVALKETLGVLADALQDLSGEAKEYFQELKVLGEMVLKDAHDQPSF